jgi:hypothetical protein
MTVNFQNWAGAQAPVYSNTVAPLRATEITPRPSGALRYRCPVNNSLVLVTDEVTLAGLDRREGLLRCVGCGETHLLTCESDLDDDTGSALLPVRGIVGALAKL